MRFILNLIFYALLFYVIWLFFPEVFDTVLRWLNALASYIHDQIGPYLNQAPQHHDIPKEAVPAP